jgi:LysR family transcriptional regulator, regulator of abg operon
MQTTHLLNFIAVIETGSVRGAAKRLGVSPAAISKNLNALERKLGVTLISRSARGAEPSDFGRSLLKRARVIEAELDRARDDIAAMIGERQGSVSIGISPTAECLLLPRALPGFRQVYADIPVRMMGGTVSSTIKALREGLLDFAVGSATAFSQEPDLRKERLLNSEMTIIARPANPLSGARRLEMLRDAEWVINAAVSDPDPATVVMFRRSGLRPPTRAIYCDSFSAVLTLVMQTDMLAVATRASVERYTRAKLLDTVELETPPPAIVQCLYTRADSPLTAPAKVLVAEFRKAARALRVA